MHVGIPRDELSRRGRGAHLDLVPGSSASRVVETGGDAGKSHTLEAGDCRLALYEGVLDPAEPQLIFWNGDVEA